jgi:hypothetical protein
MKIVDDHEVTKSEMITRFVFGAIFGILPSLFVVYRFDLSSFGAIATSVILVFGSGVLALIHGDRFWIALFGTRER